MCNNDEDFVDICGDLVLDRNIVNKTPSPSFLLLHSKVIAVADLPLGFF